MKRETEIELRLSPGAHGTNGAPWGVVLLAMLLGVAAGFAAARASRRWRRRGRRTSESAELAAAPLRLPGESPDVESEL
jgi:hypothetical protein